MARLFAFCLIMLPGCTEPLNHVHEPEKIDLTKPGCYYAPEEGGETAAAVACWG